jgi:hypothetical protein
MTQDILDIQLLIRACVSGDMDARQRFQEEYGEDIYNFPIKIYGIPLEETANFYVYAFEKNRIFTRLRTFEGRNNIQFRTFLFYYVLKHLFWEWRRTIKEVETISLHSPVHDSEAGERTLEDVLPSSDSIEEETLDQQEVDSISQIWNSLSREEQLDSKLLSLLECDLTPEDIRLLAKISGRSLQDTLAVLAEVQEDLKKKDKRISRLCDELDSVWGWILLRRKELQETCKKIHLLSEKGATAKREKLLQQREVLEHALAKRENQRQGIREKMQTYKLTTPYQDIARLLNLTVGTVCSRIFRLRERLERKLVQGRLIKE